MGDVGAMSLDIQRKSISAPILRLVTQPFQPPHVLRAGIVARYNNAFVPLRLSSVAVAFMRFRFSNVVFRTLYTLSHFTRARAAQQQVPLLQHQQRVASIPILGSLFGTKAAADPAKMSKSYPDQRTDDEWRAVLSPGEFLFGSSPRCSYLTHVVRAIPHPPRERHREARHGRVRQALPHRGRLHLRWLQRPPLHGLAQV